jgi:flavoprotein
MVSILLHSQTQVHIFHLQTKSYSEHKALQGYYEGIDGLVDGIIESYQGKYDVVNGYNSIKTEEYKSSEQVIKYFKALDSMVEKNRKSVKESFLQNQIDTVQELIYSTLYKLRFLK